MAERAMTANVEDVKEDRKERRRGQFCGLAIAAIGIIVSAVVVWLVPNASGATVGRGNWWINAYGIGSDIYYGQESEKDERILKHATKSVAINGTGIAAIENQ